MATFADNAPTLNLVLGTNQSVGIVSTGTAYSLTLSSGTWTGSNDSLVTGSGLSTLTVTSAGVAAFTSAINITDTGSTGGDAVAFNNSQSSAYFNPFNITLGDATAAGALSFNGTTTFSGTASLSAAVNGSISVNAGASISMTSGSLRLASTGTNTALNDNGNIVDLGGAVTLEATGNVTVGSQITINAITGPLTLAADVTANGTGDDGVGTLTISSGATVATDGALTLRGATENIAMGSDPAVVGAVRTLSTSVEDLTQPGLAHPSAMAYDSSGDLFVANGSSPGTIEEFAPGATTARAILTGVQDPVAMAFDSSGNLYVANAAALTVSKFAPGATTPTASLQVNSSPVYAMAFDSSGDLFVGSSGGVSKFAPGATTASLVITGLNDPGALLFDSSGNLYVANTGSPDGTTVSVFAPGATTASRTLTGLLGPDALALDASGNLYVANNADGAGTTVSVFSPGATTAATTISGLNGPEALLISGSNLFVTNANGTTVSEFATGSTTAAATLTGLSEPDALLLDSSGNLHVANATAGSISTFAPGATTANATLSGGPGDPVALAFDASGNLYVADGDDNTVSKYTPGAATASAILTGLNDPTAEIFNSSGYLYVANAGPTGGGTVSVFAPGATTATQTLTGLHSPHALAFDSEGDLYVANWSNNTVNEFAPGATTALLTISGFQIPYAFAFNTSGDLFVANESGTTVAEFAPGTTTALATLVTPSSPRTMAFDANGNLYVADTSGVSEFAPGATIASELLTGVTHAASLLLDTNGNLYAATYSGGTTIGVFRPGATTASIILTGTANPAAIAFDTSGDLFIANDGYNQVSEYPASSLSATAASITIQSSVESRPMQIGTTTNTVGSGIYLTNAELAQLDTTAAGSITIGDPSQTGNITISTATPATTAGAATNVIQSTSGAGQIILDDGSGAATALSGNGGNVSLTAGTGGIAALSASNSTAEIATTGASVTLLTAGAIGSSTNRIQFADNSNTAEQVVSVGSTTVQPSSVYLDGLGSLTLGSIQGSTANTTIDATARTNLVVVSGATINSGLSTLSLGADLTAAKLGNDGIGTLSISSGSTVTSTNPSSSAITLRGANVNIDTSADPAIVGAGRTLATSPSVAYQAGLSKPRALAFDASGNLYVANVGNASVSEYAPGATAPTAIISGVLSPVALAFDSSGNLYVAADGSSTVFKYAPGSTVFSAKYTAGISSPDALAMDSSGNLYVANSGNNTVRKFAPGSTTASATYSTGLSQPDALAFDAGGDLFVASAGNNTVVEFAAGSTTPIATFSAGLSDPVALAFDAGGNLYVANEGNATVTKFAPAVTTSAATYSAGLASPVALGFDSSGNLYVANEGGATVSRFTSGSTTLSATLVGLLAPDALAFDHSGNVYVASLTGSTVAKYAAGATTASTIYPPGLSTPDALAIDSGGDVYVANEFGNTVSEFAPGGTTAIATYSANLSILSVPDALVIDSSGNLYVASEGTGTVVKFAAGSTTVSAIYPTGGGDPEPDALALDSSGNLYVGNYVDNTVVEFPAGSTKASATYSAGVETPVALAFDSRGNLYVVNEFGATVSEFAPGSTTASVIYADGLGLPSALAFDSSGNLYVADEFNDAIVEFASGSTLPNVTYTTGVDTPFALAFDLRGNLYVANYSNNTVSEFAPGSTAVAATFSSNVSSPAALGLDAGGDLYVANQSGAAALSKFSAVATAPTAGGVTIQSSVESLPMQIGSTINTPASGIYLTNAELAQIYTTATGTITIGDLAQTGNITISTATPATTAGAATDVIQSTSGAGQIILDDGSGAATALNGNGGNVSLTAGTGGIVALAANNSTAEISTTGASVTLLTVGAIGSSTNRIQFADNSNTAEQVVSAGSSSVQPSSVYLDGLGSLTLGSIFGGTSNAMIDVTARTNLVVSAGATITSGTNTISLGADLTASETGDNGVGTLSINSGATVNSTSFSPSAITLRGAAMNINTSGTPAIVEANRPQVTTAIANLIGIDSEFSPVFDSSGDLFVANYNGTTVSEFAPGATTPTATLFGLDKPDSMAFDSSGNLYVTNGAGTTVSEFAPGATTPTVTLTGFEGPFALAISGGYLYVADSGHNEIKKYALGATTPSAILKGLDDPIALAVDSSGNVYADNDGGPFTVVSKFAPGATTPTATLTGVNVPWSFAIDSSGDLFVANFGSTTVSRFAPGATTPDATLTGLSSPMSLTFDSQGNLYVVSAGNGTVSEFAPGATTAGATFAGPLDSDSVAFDSSGNMYVAGYLMVSKFTDTAFATGGVTIRSSLESLPMQIGTTTNTPASGVYLTNAELAQITTAADGSITFGDAGQTGNITFSDATPARTAGAAVNVIQSSAGAGAIILDDSAGTALNGNGGSVTLSTGTGGIQTTLYSGKTPLVSDGFTATGSISVALAFLPSPGQQLTVMSNSATPAGSNPINGTFANLGQGTTTQLNYQSTPASFQANYQGGDGNDLVLTNVAGPATHLVITGSPPATVTAGAGFGFTVAAEDVIGNLATSFSGLATVSLASNPDGGTLAGTLTVTVSSGLTTFSGLALNKVSSGYTLAIDSNSLTSATSGAISVTPGAAAQLLITGGLPASVTAGIGFGFTVTAEDAEGNLVTAFSGSETVALLSNPGPSTLGGSLSVSAVGGVATFSGLTLNKAGAGYTLAIDSGTLTAATSSAISVSPGAATQLLIASEPPTSVTAGTPFGLTVTAEDAFGNLATSFNGSETVTLALNPSSGSLGGTITASSTGGVATFSNLLLDKAAIGYLLTVAGGSLASATTAAISVTPGAATQLVITSQPPTTVTAGNPFALSVAVEDAYQNLVPGFDGSVTVALQNNPGSATLGGTPVQNAASGMATFADLTLNMPGTGYTLELSSGSLTSTTSSSIYVPPVLMITGTSNSNDDINVTFSSPTQFSVSSGSTPMGAYSTTNFNQLVYNAPTGGTFSKLIFDDANDAITANQSLGSTTISDGTLQFQANGTTNLYLYGGPSSSATVDVSNGGSTSSNFFVVDTLNDYSYIADPGTGAYSELSGFGSETTTGSMGTTYAYIYSTSNAKTVASPTQTTFTVGGVTSTLSNFPQVYVVGAKDGSDSVTLDSSGGTFVSSPGFSYVGGTSNGTNFLLGAIYAANIKAQAAGSSDKAVFYSYASDTFAGTPGTSSLSGMTTNVAGTSVQFVSQALGYSSVSVFESGSGTDMANLTSPGNGSYFGTDTAGVLTVGTGTITVNSYFVNTSNQTVTVPAQIAVTGAGNGTDTADIYDAPGNNALSAANSTAALTTAYGALTINKFGSVTANQQNGTNDTVHEGAIDFALKTVGNWTSD